MLKEDILHDIEQHYQLKILQTEAIDGGWLNRLHRIRAIQGSFLIKEYSRERYKSDTQLHAIESALARQEQLRQASIPTVRILRPNGSAVRILGDGTAYTVMDWCDGKNLSPQEITLSQMCSLGKVCAKMHAAFAMLPTEGAKVQYSSGKALQTALKAHLEAFSDAKNAACRSAVHGISALLNQLPDRFFDQLRIGLAHEDFTPDNLLFDDHGIQAVIDFDRNCISFPLHDVGRALLSFALSGNSMRKDYVSAFVDGYREYFPLTECDIYAALLLCLCIEAPWWFRPLFFETNQGKATRFLQEILWVQEHAVELATGWGA